MNKSELSTENVIRLKDYSNPGDYFSEAVFKDGKKSVEAVEKAFEAVKAELELEIETQKKSRKKVDRFDPEKFFKHNVFKKLEDVLMDIFGFRSVIIEPLQEKYDRKNDEFESKMMNAFIYNMDRYPIEGLLTDKGFYDKSKSTYIHIILTLGIIRNLEANELTAVLLHEFGHGIDPALVTISYTDTNILTKYLTDRKDKLTDKEKERKKNLGESLIVSIIYLLVLTLPILWDWFRKLIFGKDKVRKDKMKKIEYVIKKDKDKFNRIDMAEAYADNFARMYGYGPELMKALKKLNKENFKDLSRIKLESWRESALIHITIAMIKDEHKTDIHRIKNLIKEYENDINDKNIPKKVKEQMEEDKKELELILKSYTEDFDEFQNLINQTLIEELDRKEGINKLQDLLK